MLPKTNFLAIALSMLTMLLMPILGESPNDFFRTNVALKEIDDNVASISTRANSVHRSIDLEAAIERTYLWAWPMVYLHNLRKPLRLIRRPGVAGGAPVAPINQMCMLTDLISPAMRSIPCPNRDVIYGFAALDLTSTAVVVQVPDFKNRFWLYQIGDHRTESFAQLGSLHHSEPGFYLIVGPNWQGEIPDGIENVFHSPTNLAYIIPRVHVSESEQDRQAVQKSLCEINAYPLHCYNGKMKNVDWRKKKWYPEIGTCDGEASKWVRPEKFFDDLNEVLNDYIPTAHEQALYQDARQLVELAQSDVTFAANLSRQSIQIEKLAISKLFDFHHVGREAGSHWTTVDNGANFGDDFVSRTAVAMSNIFVNRAEEAKYFHVDQSSDGELLTGQHQYTITFPANQLPPNNGFWSLTLYDVNHSLYENPWNRYAIGSNTSNLNYSSDGSLKILVSETQPENHNINWLPCPASRFSLYLRVYAPSIEVVEGHWQPPAIDRN